MKSKLDIILGGCLSILKTIDENSIDMVFADSPYNLSNGCTTCYALGDIVFDPFNVSRTTTVVCKNRNNKYMFWQFSFKNKNDYNSISLLKSKIYEIQ